MKPQNRDVLALLEAHPEGVTPYDALTLVGCFRLAARIRELRDDGFAIWDESVRVTNRYGQDVRVKRYGLRVAA